MKNNNKINKMSLNKIKQKNQSDVFSLEVSLNELINNQSETKTKIDSQIKLCPKKITKNRFKVQCLKQSSLLLSVNMNRSKA